MTSGRPLLGWALVLSMLLHALLLAASDSLLARLARTERAVLSALTVRLPERPAVPVPQPRLLQPPAPVPQAKRPATEPPRNASADRPPAPVTKQSAALRTLPEDAARSAMEQLARDLPYPQEAIERGLQGETLVLLFLDAAGNVVAARVERSSGHEILDEAAVRAARGLRAMPLGAWGAASNSAPREALLPVRFRLR